MAKIRVDPAILKDSSRIIASTSNSVRLSANNLISVASIAPSYDGQFGSKVRAISNAANFRAQAIFARESIFSDKLKQRAQLFQNEDSPNYCKLPSLYRNSIFIQQSLILQIMKSLASHKIPFGLQKIHFAFIPSLRKIVSFKVDVNQLLEQKQIWQSGPGRPPLDKKKIELKIKAGEISAWKLPEGATRPIETALGGIRAGFQPKLEAGKVEGGVGVGLEKGKGFAGAYGSVTALTGGASGMIGSKEKEIGGDITIKAGHLEGFAGYRDGTVGAKLGGSLVSAEGTLGLNMAGSNVGVTAGIGAKFELGLQVGKNSRLFLGPFTIGLNISEALGY